MFITEVQAVFAIHCELYMHRLGGNKKETKSEFEIDSFSYVQEDYWA